MTEYEEEYFDIVVNTAYFEANTRDCGTTEEIKDSLRQEVVYRDKLLKELREQLGYSPVSLGDRLETDSFLFDPKGEKILTLYDPEKALELSRSYIETYCKNPSAETAKRLEIGLKVFLSPEILDRNSGKDAENVA